MLGSCCNFIDSRKHKTGIWLKRTINYNKYLAKIKNQARNRYLDNLIDPKFQGVNRLFVLSLRMTMVEKVTSNIVFQLWK